MLVRHYLHGGYYPLGGSWKIADTIVPKIQAAGGEVFTYARVECIVADAGKVTGVKMQDGHFIECPCVISSAGVGNTFRHLLPADIAEKAGYRRKLESVEPSFAHSGVYIGLKKTAGELGLPKTNFWIYPDNDYDAAVERFLRDSKEAFPVVYISFPSAKDPDYLERHPGAATIEIVAPAPYEWFKKWHDETWGKRGEVDYYEVSTPLSSNWFTAYQQGELYGLAHTPGRMKQKWLRPKTTIPGLWLTGQDILTCGVTGAMMAGMLTTTGIVGMRKIAPLMKRIYS